MDGTCTRRQIIGLTSFSQMRNCRIVSCSSGVRALLVADNECRRRPRVGFKTAGLGENHRQTYISFKPASAMPHNSSCSPLWAITRSAGSMRASSAAISISCPATIPSVIPVRRVISAGMGDEG